MITEQNDVIERIRAFPAGEIYSIGPKEFILRGFDYYTRERVESYSWSADGSLLSAHVRGSRLYCVQFTSHQGDLVFSCDCPIWSELSQCKHVVCALITTINLLFPSHFKLAGRTPEHRDRLESALFRRLAPPEAGAVDALPSHPGRKRPSPRYEILLVDREAALSVYVRRDGSRVETSWAVPPALGTLIAHGLYSSRFLSEILFRYFSDHGNAYPILWVSDEGETPLEWDPLLKYEAKTQLDVISGQVEVRAICLLNDVVREKAHRFFNFVADLETRRLGIVGDPRGWSLFELLEAVSPTADSLAQDPEREEQERAGSVYLSGQNSEERSLPRYRMSGRRSFKMPLLRFQSIQINIPDRQAQDILNRLTLKSAGRQDPIVNSSHSYRLTIDPLGQEDPQKPAEPSCTLRAECLLDNATGTPTVPAFSYFTYLENHRGLSPALKTQKRKAVLYEAFFSLLSVRKKHEVEKRIRESLSRGDFNRHAVRSEAKSILRYFLSLFWESDLRLRFDKGRWHLIAVDKAREALLYQIPFEIFGPKIFRNSRSHDEMFLPVDSLHEGLSLLNTRLKHAGMELYYKNRPVVASHWDFSFDARRPPGVDWFEIRPEIRCDGKIVEEALWTDLLGRGGVLEREHYVQILDSNAHEVVKALSLIYQSKGSKEAGRDSAEGSPYVKEIVRTPRLQILDWISLRKRGVRITLPHEDEAVMTSLTHFETIEKSPLPKRLRAKLRPYQKEGYDWLSFLYRHRFGACLADDMGLGKTLQAITLLAGIKERKVLSLSPAPQNPHLVVLPPSLLFNWENEITRFYPDFKIHFYTGRERGTDFKDADIVLTTYGLIRRDIETLKEIPFHVVIFDEAQAIKNIYANTTGAVRQLKAFFKMVMTGTPLENHVGEYYSLIDLSLPGLLGDYDDFKSQIHAGQSPRLELLIRRTRPFVLRRTKEKILKDLPPKIETDVYLDLTAKQKALYQVTVSQIQSKIDDAYRTKSQAQAKIIALTAILKLRQLCVSPRLIAPQIDEPSPKIEFLIGQLKELLEAGHSALVFSQFTSFLDLLEEPLKEAVIPFLRLDGSTATEKRKRLVVGFQEGEQPAVFLLSLKAGGQGLNLTKASYVFHLDPWWNPAVENQASDRAHRIGQKNKVSITRILMRHTIEEKMMELKKKKLDLYRAVMEDDLKNGDRISISRSDFDFLLEFPTGTR